MLDALRELGVGLVPYSPLGRGFLTGTVDVATLDAKDFRARNPRFIGQAGAANQAIADAVRGVAEARGIAPAQVALAWVHGQGERLGIPLAPIPGTKRVKWLEQNVAAVDVKLTADDLAALYPPGRPGPRRPLLTSQTGSVPAGGPPAGTLPFAFRGPQGVPGTGGSRHTGGVDPTATCW